MITYRVKNKNTREMAFAVGYNSYCYAIYRTDFIACATDAEGIGERADKSSWEIVSTIEHDNKGNILNETFQDFEYWWEVNVENAFIGVMNNAFKEIARRAWKAAKGE